ncbi:MAG: hypothetical protein BMS9Abin12_1177 [Acidimicrobiia bacterium]|nr:MAG: hypothetical protein BMS9Abin12_1177 [Acidimicrobiia bacterium]
MGTQSRNLRIGLGILTGLLATAALIGFILLAVAIHT